MRIAEHCYQSQDEPARGVNAAFQPLRLLLALVGLFGPCLKRLFIV
jgi:hypothetical protein